MRKVLLEIVQNPAALRASPGETATLSCSFENTQGSLAKATWTRAPGVVLDSAHPFYRGRLRMSHLDLLQKGEATLTLSELEQRDSGLYQCHISIRKGESGRGAGTELLVTGRNQSDTGEVGNGGTGPSPSMGYRCRPGPRVGDLLAQEVGMGHGAFLLYGALVQASPHTSFLLSRGSRGT
uniref:Natural cytotoxicity triggering receptor 3 n=1 Tax=Gopherus agassizii TaxID=38772 RepID=A0A452HI59_9SAUR